MAREGFWEVHRSLDLEKLAADRDMLGLVDFDLCLDRAGTLLAAKPTLLLRYTRLMLTEYLKKQVQDLLGYGLAMEGLALMERPDQPDQGG